MKRDIVRAVRSSFSAPQQHLPPTGIAQQRSLDLGMLGSASPHPVAPVTGLAPSAAVQHEHFSHSQGDCRTLNLLLSYHVFTINLHLIFVTFFTLLHNFT
jgi:hypothetical protein